MKKNNQMFLVIVTLVVAANCKSLGTVTDRNVTKRAGNGDYLFPDWVPFKNKHGEELGEFVQVPKKKKPAKRLAPPASFILKAAAEPESDDYYDKGQAGSDGDDYYEKRDWSDTNRPAENVDNKAVFNNPNISDIDGLVDIITKPNPITDILKKNSKQKTNGQVVSVEGQDDKPTEKKENREESESNEPNLREEKETNDSKDEKSSKEEDEYYEEESPEEKAKAEAAEKEKTENEARKAKILSSVDDLKHRHQQEQKLLTEKLKEEEMSQEEHLRYNMKTNEDVDKYGNPGSTQKLISYDDYDEADVVNEKYKIKPVKRTSTTTASRATKRGTSKYKGSKDKHVESGKLSVFKNPRMYMVYDDDVSTETTEVDEITTIKPKVVTKTKKASIKRFSSKYTTPVTLGSEENVRISLVPEDDGGKGEPTLFFPKRRKTKLKRKTKNSKKSSTTNAPDSFVAESDKVENGLLVNKTSIPISGPLDSSKEASAFDKEVTASGSAPSAPESAPSAQDVALSSQEVAASAPDTAPSALGSAPSADSAPSAASAASAVAADAVSAPSEHHKKPKKNENFEQEKGDEREHHSEHHEDHEEHGKKAYKGIHKDTKTQKGHHDKEDHLGKYDDHGGVDKEHHLEKNHYGVHHHEEHGKKHAKYEESGKHSKGHSTKGSHDIHKKEEYEKKVEFFEEEGDSAEEEKRGGDTHEQEHSSGGKFKKGNLAAAYTGHAKGDTGHFEKGSHGHKNKGYKGAAGHDSHGKHGSEHHHKEGHNHGKKWVYHHGHPAKTANLVVIDRRMDNYFHGPRYFG